MNPKEKAFNLLQTFGASTMSFEEGAFNGGMTLPQEVAKKLALIAVGEILHAVVGAKVEGSNYWSFVKEELEKL